METGQFIFREASRQDVPSVGRIFGAAVARMLAEGKKQWTGDYPRAEHALADVEEHTGYVLESAGHVVAYGAVIFTGEPAYTRLRGERMAFEKLI